MKKSGIKMVGLLLLLPVLLSLCVLSAQAEGTKSGVVIYVDAAKGSDGNSGLSADVPVATLRGAYKVLPAAAKTAGITNDPSAVAEIIVSGMDTAGFKNSGTTTTGFSGSHVYTVRISGKAAGDGITFAGNLNIPGPTVFENITLVSDATAKRYLSANGHPLTIGEGVTSVAAGSSGTYFSIVGGKHNASAGQTPHTGDTSITVKSGVWEDIYFGNSNNNLTGNASLVMTGGEVKGDVKTMNGVGTFTGNETLLLSDCAVHGTVALSGNSGNTQTLQLRASTGKTLTLAGVGTLHVDSFSGGGTLVLSKGAALRIDSVSGTTALKVAGPVTGQKYITVKNGGASAFTDADAADVHQLTGSTEGSGTVWTFAGGGETPVVKLTVPEEVLLTVRTGFTGGKVVTPDQITTEKGISTYVFSSLNAGSYRYETLGDGYYNIEKYFNITAEDLRNGKVINADPGKMSGNGYEPTGKITLRPDELLEQCFPSSKTMWGKEYESVFVTPAFDGTDAAHEFTSQEELMAFINALDDPNDNMYVYSLGKSAAYQFDIPLIVFTSTNLKGKTLEEAAAILKDQKKPMVQYMALVHGCEPAASEGALAVVNGLDGTYGDGILDRINIYVIPRVNVDGAVTNTANSVAEGVETNRDYMQLDATEIGYVHRAYNLFLPDVVVDSHEFAPTNLTSEGEHALPDVCVGGAGNENAPASLNDLAWKLQTDTMLNAFKDHGLRAVNYTNTYLTDPGPHRGRGHFNLLGSISVLFESCGQKIGRTAYERRVFTHYVGVTYVFDYVAEHAAEIQTTVDAARQELIDKGATYEADTKDDRVVLEHKLDTASSPKKVKVAIPTFSYVDGSVVDANKTKYVYVHQAVRVRTRPTAYVISKSESWAADAVDRLVKSGVSCYELESNAAVKLQQYMGTESAVTLGEETVVIFEDGAYVFPMNQAAANIIALRMEPDVTDSSGYDGSLLQSGYFVANGGAMPVYRYIHDLKDGKVTEEVVPAAPTELKSVQPEMLGADGKITGLDPAKQYEYKEAADDGYTAVPAGTTEITGLGVGVYSVRYAETASTQPGLAAKLEIIDRHISEYAVYLGGANADDKNNGLTPEKAVATLDKAYEKLDKIMAFAPKGTEGKIVFLSEIVVEKNGNDKTNDWHNLPGHKYKVILTGKTGNEGIRSGVIIAFHGDTELTNLTITSTATGTPFLAGNGYQLTVGENITSVPNGTSYYGIVGGGKMTSGVAAGSTNLVVKSGTWAEIHAGGYTPLVMGNARLTMTGGTVTGNIYAAFYGNIGGDVIMNISGATVNGTIYGGHMYGNNATKSVGGDVTIILGEGTKVGTVYGGGVGQSYVKGTVSIVLDGVETVGMLHGGGAGTGKVGGSVLVLRSGRIPAALKAETERIVADLSGGSVLTLENSLTVDELIGGGTVTLPVGKTLTVNGSVTETTEIAFDGAVSAGAAAVIAPAGTADGAFISASALAAVSDGTNKTWSVDASHTHNFKDVASNQQAAPATCQAAATYYVRCDGCTVISETVTVVVGNPAAHNFTDRPSEVEAGEGSVYVRCDNCDAVSDTLTVAAESGGEPGTDPTPTPDAQSGGIWIIAAAAVCVAVGVLVVYQKQKKGKK